MLSADFVILTAIGYVGLLFLLAYVSDQRAKRGNAGFLRSPFVYTLSISVYCTSWTFYGAVGTAARDGLEFTAIYLGPTLVFVGWWFILRKLVRISQTLRITSVADLLSSRFGKSSRLAVVVTLIAIINVTPYIALQLKAITTSIQVVSAANGPGGGRLLRPRRHQPGFRRRRRHGAVYGAVRHAQRRRQGAASRRGGGHRLRSRGQAPCLAGRRPVCGVRAERRTGGHLFPREEAGIEIYDGSFWAAVGPPSCSCPRRPCCACRDSSRLRWLRIRIPSICARPGGLFPVYLLLMSTLRVPIALYGLTTLPEGSNPDMFVLTLPMAAGTTPWRCLSSSADFQAPHR